MLYRASMSDGTGYDFVLSDGSLDRHGTRINPDGWELAAFKRNPIALFGHSGGFPVGRWENVRAESGKLMGRLVLAAQGTSQRIDELRALVEQGILRAVSVGFSVLEYGKPGKDQHDFQKQELLEVSLVSVPSNTNALAIARGLNLSPETLSLAFGAHAEAGSGRASAGEHAKRHPEQRHARTAPQGTRTMTLSQRIEAAQSDLNLKRDKLTELTGAADLDLDAIGELNGQVEHAERLLATLKASEQRIGLNAGSPAAEPETRAGHNGGPPLTNINRRPIAALRDVSGLDLLTRAVVAQGVAHFTRTPIEAVLDQRYPGHQPTAIMARADQTIGTSTVSGWASEIVQTAYADFLQALVGYSVYPALRDRGIKLSFDGVGTVSIPSRTAGGAGGGFVAEGSPIRVGRITTAATTMTAKKLGVIVPFSRELAKRSTPMIESLVRQAILEDTGAILDAAVLDATAASTARPAGLLNGVSATATGYGGGDYEAVMRDFQALMAVFTAANAADNITVVMNPAQGLALAMMVGPSGVPNWFQPVRERISIIESTNATAARLIALRNSDLATALGDAPEFDISEQAVVHMEDTTPLEIVAGTPTTADPVRSFWQTGTIGVRMIMDVSWKMRRSGMVAWINGTSW